MPLNYGYKLLRYCSPSTFPETFASVLTCPQNASGAETVKRSALCINLLAYDVRHAFANTPQLTDKQSRAPSSAAYQCWARPSIVGTARKANFRRGSDLTQTQSRQQASLRATTARHSCWPCRAFGGARERLARGRLGAAVIVEVE